VEEMTMTALQRSKEHDGSGRGPAPSRLSDLEQRFHDLEEHIEESPVRQALSVLHGMIQEVRRERRKDAGSSARPLDDIANLYRRAPAMEGAALTKGLAVGTRAPDFALPGASGEVVRLKTLLDLPLVLVFYPLDWSPGCSQQLDLYRDEKKAFEARGTRVAAISVDSIYSHGAWAAVRGLDMTLLSDFHPKGGVARAYQVYRDEDGFSDRALFLIDTSGVIRHATVSPFLHHVPDIEELFGAIDALVASSVPVRG
jgi:peroxiredoxin